MPILTSRFLSHYFRRDHNVFIIVRLPFNKVCIVYDINDVVHHIYAMYGVINTKTMYRGIYMYITHVYAFFLVGWWRQPCFGTNHRQTWWCSQRRYFSWIRRQLPTSFSDARWLDALLPLRRIFNYTSLLRSRNLDCFQRLRPNQWKTGIKLQKLLHSIFKCEPMI